MNRIVCQRGHFYDGDKYLQCPHCMDGTAAVCQDSFAFAPGGAQNGRRELSKDRRDDEVTLILPREYLPNSEATPEPFSPQVQEAPSWGKEVQAWPQNLPPKPEEILSEEVESEDAQFKKDTVLDLEEILPPVGYLVCIRGRDYGKGFPLKTGVNTVKGQAYVLYEPRKREFYLKLVDSGSLCYCNDEVLLEPRKIQGYDRITLGDTSFLLIAVCGEKFSWEENA